MASRRRPRQSGGAAGTTSQAGRSRSVSTYARATSRTLTGSQRSDGATATMVGAAPPYTPRADGGAALAVAARAYGGNGATRGPALDWW